MAGEDRCEFCGAGTSNGCYTCGRTPSAPRSALCVQLQRLIQNGEAYWAADTPDEGEDVAVPAFRLEADWQFWIACVLVAGIGVAAGQVCWMIARGVIVDWLGGTPELAIGAIAFVISFIAYARHVEHKRKREWEKENDEEHGAGNWYEDPSAEG